MLSIAQGDWQGFFLHVLDDASDDFFAKCKTELLEDLLNRKVIHRYDRLEEQAGFCRGREMIVNRFLSEPLFRAWLHLDDDLLVGEHFGQAAISDLFKGLDGRSLLHLYINPWSKWNTVENTPFAKVTKIGGAAFAISREAMLKVGNPYVGETDGEKANAKFWGLLRAAGIPMMLRRVNPHPCQHTGNVESVIFGHTPTWEHLYATNPVTKRIIEVPPFKMDELRKHIKARNLSGYVWRANTACRVKIKLPLPGSIFPTEIR